MESKCPVGSSEGRSVLKLTRCKIARFKTPTLPNEKALFTEVKQIFDMYDKNGDNVINVEELKGILEILGYSPSPEEVERILVKFDQDESGTIDFDEYLCLIQTWIEQDEEQIYEAFKVFDKDGDGFVSAQELKRALTQYGEQFTEEEANEFFNMMDTDGDGVINYEEFVEYLRSMQKYSTE